MKNHWFLKPSSFDIRKIRYYIELWKTVKVNFLNSKCQYIRYILPLTRASGDYYGQATHHLLFITLYSTSFKGGCDVHALFSKSRRPRTFRLKAARLRDHLIFLADSLTLELYLKCEIIYLLGHFLPPNNCLSNSYFVLLYETIVCKNVTN